MVSLRAEIGALESGEEIACRVSDGSLIRGQVLRLRRDQAGVRVELCPFAREEPQYRIQIPRTRTGWRRPYVERRAIDDEHWHRYAAVAALE